MMLRQYRAIVAQGFRTEWAERERIVSPLLFAAVAAIIFVFALGEVDDASRMKVFIGEAGLCVFFALQMAFARAFDAFAQDKIFDVMRTYRVSSSAWYFAMLTNVFVLSAATALPTILLCGLLNGQDVTFLLTAKMCGLCVLTLLCLSALGVLLAAMTLKASSRQILFPILYFPLTAPVLLAATQATLDYVTAASLPSAGTSFGSWFTLLASFATIYTTLGWLLFGEIVEAG